MNMTTTKTFASLLAITLTSAAAGGCLLRDQFHTWYLQPDGAVSWQVIEKDVRSDAESGRDRADEESTYINAVRQDDHPIARGFSLMAASSVRTELLRTAPPFTVVTEARFPSLGVLGEGLLAAAQQPGTSTLDRLPGGLTWTFTIRVAEPGDHADDFVATSHSHGDDPASELLNQLENLHVVLVRGSFTAARGFELSSDKRVATLKSDNDSIGETIAPGTFMMRLSWTDGE